MSGKRTISTTMRPNDRIEVDSAEYLDLSRQGLVHEEYASNKQNGTIDVKPATAPKREGK